MNNMEFLPPQGQYPSHFGLQGKSLLNYSINQQIGQGNYGNTYEFLFSKERKLFAGKFMPKLDNSPLENCALYQESRILRRLCDEPGFPRYEDLLSHNGNRVLVMSLLGPNLSSLQKKCGGKLSLKTVLMIAIQAIQRLNSLHSIGFLHRDIKPENFLIGIGKKGEKIIHLIDFGLSTEFLDKNLAHIPFDYNAGVRGTFVYLSTFNHLKIQASRRDDLISLGYMLLQLFFGELPWENVWCVYRVKANITIEELCKGLPKEFRKYFNYVLNMGFEKTPDYEYLSGIFYKILRKNQFLLDFEFDWVEKNENQTGINLKTMKIQMEPLNKYKKVLDVFDGDREINMNE